MGYSGWDALLHLSRRERSTALSEAKRGRVRGYDIAGQAQRPLTRRASRVDLSPTGRGEEAPPPRITVTE
jgi:hypothetical protein